MRAMHPSPHLIGGDPLRQSPARQQVGVKPGGTCELARVIVKRQATGPQDSTNPSKVKVGPIEVTMGAKLHPGAANYSTRFTPAAARPGQRSIRLWIGWD